ncbi:virulence protein SrfB [Roseospira marina]|uniref:Virulence protein SrfB n=1 Tax=Roseospira marina TaxID=140057 RepID=A0A5M6I835_9PROT|nr:virulence factor SrfB [Roseospira marina]KAA5603908.1 virulence protein SrfB [Roseospira marina]MBB4315969.1 hypothetical protein [Roseospira marina]MBB5089161.1 hypothetical protein [Roseospira marina]
MLKPLTLTADIAVDAQVITLVPYSGIQFIDFGFNAETVRSTASFWERESAEAPPEGAVAAGVETPDDESGPKAWYQLFKLEQDPETRELVLPGSKDVPPEDEVYRIAPKKILENYAHQWIPVPMLRQRDRGPGGRPILDIGPTNWARAMIVPLDTPETDGTTHRVVLAVDTTLAERSQRRGYSAPTREDSDREDDFLLGESFETVSWFCALPWIREWLDRLYRTTQRRGRSPKDGHRLEAYALYVAFVDLLHAALSPPPLKLLDTMSESSSRSSIPVDLVLDIGNSRTCGVLIEDQPGTDEVDLSQSYALELRDLGNPCHVYSDPFESRVEFSRAEFGFSDLNRHAGRGTAFNWASLVRVGPEAARLAGSSVGNDGATGLSSPKRYLWDTQEARMPWRFNGRASDTGTLEPVVGGNLMRYLTDTGGVLATLSRKQRPAMTPLFSRSSLFMMMLVEILQQALSQINAPAVRAERRRRNEPRHLARVIMSLPSATPLPELKILRERAREAVALVWATMKAEAYDAPLPPRPEIDPKWDEASATQLVYLFTEIKHNFQGDMRAFFRLMGRERPRIGESLRVASIDIGGGTTDLIVTTYTHEQGRAIRPHQEFRESFRLAGDDILQAVVEQQVMHAIGAALRAAGVHDDTPILTEAFVGDRAGLSEQQRHRRKQFVNKCLIPIALHLMHRSEEVALGVDPPPTTVRWEEIFPPESETAPSDAVLRYLDEPLSEILGRPWSIREVPFVVDMQALTNTVWGVIGDVLRLFGEVVHAMNCDILLLSGRPSRLPAVQELVFALAAVPADRVVPMHHYAAGSWYPFRDALGRIEDPKTTAVVGSALCELASGQIHRFRIESHRLELKSTARYIGEMEQSGYIKNDRLFFSDLDLDDPSPKPLSHTFEMLAPMEIGFRQLGIERWPATLLYRLGPSDRRDFQRYPAPWRCVIERSDIDQDDVDSEEKKEIFSIEEAVDRDDNDVPPNRVHLRLQTLQSEQGYWLDTGILRLT